MKNAFSTTECWAAGGQIRVRKEEARVGVANAYKKRKKICRMQAVIKRTLANSVL
jgi:hypothetical protein